MELGRSPTPRTGSGHRGAPRSLGSFVAGYKAAVTTHINTLRDTRGTPIWQRGYYEHIIRTPQDWDSIAVYIATNPQQWQADRENPNAQR